jgi:hypothetical protein
MKNIMYALSIILTLVACNKQKKIKIDTKIELPAATQTGANTSGCTINGINYAAYGSEKGAYPGPSFSGPNSVYNLWGAKEIETYFSDRYLRISIDENPIVGDNSAKFNSEMKVQGQVQYYYLTKSRPHTLIVSKYGNGIIACNYDFWVKNYREPFDEIHIADGRFDLKY